MINFTIAKKSKKSKARLGNLATLHGEIETPALVAVATQGVIKTLTSQEVKQTGSQILIANTYHLHLKPGESVIQKQGGLHQFMAWEKPLMTDSGGYQVFSLGFGQDYKIGKIIQEETPLTVSVHQQPKSLRITSNGVFFRSPINGDELFLGPKESVRIQEKLGADIIFAFDECPPPIADKKYTQKSMDMTHRWATECLKTKKSNQAIFGIVQGGKFKDLRSASAQIIGSLDFNGFGIGGELGFDKKEMFKMLGWVTEQLPAEKPRHLLGNGHIEDLEKIFSFGIDTLDCIIPTHYARHGIAFITHKKLDLQQSKYLNDSDPLDKNCQCFVCQTYSRSYICHLLRAKEITALKLLTFHNLTYFNKVVANIRLKIKQGKL